MFEKFQEFRNRIVICPDIAWAICKHILGCSPRMPVATKRFFFPGRGSLVKPLYLPLLLGRRKVINATVTYWEGEPPKIYLDDTLW